VLPHCCIPYLQPSGSTLCFHAKTFHKVWHGPAECVKLVLHISDASLAHDVFASPALPISSEHSSLTLSEPHGTSSRRLSSNGRLLMQHPGERSSPEPPSEPTSTNAGSDLALRMPCLSGSPALDVTANALSSSLSAHSPDPGWFEVEELDTLLGVPHVCHQSMDEVPVSVSSSAIAPSVVNLSAADHPPGHDAQSTLPLLASAVNAIQARVCDPCQVPSTSEQHAVLQRETSSLHARLGVCRQLVVPSPPGTSCVESVAVPGPPCSTVGLSVPISSRLQSDVTKQVRQAVVSAHALTDRTVLRLSHSSAALHTIQRDGMDRLAYVAKWTPLRFPPHANGAHTGDVSVSSLIEDDLHTMDDDRLTSEVNVSHLTDNHMSSNELHALQALADLSGDSAPTLSTFWETQHVHEHIRPPETLTAQPHDVLLPFSPRAAPLSPHCSVPSVPEHVQSSSPPAPPPSSLSPLGSLSYLQHPVQSLSPAPPPPASLAQVFIHAPSSSTISHSVPTAHPVAQPPRDQTEYAWPSPLKAPGNAPGKRRKLQEAVAAAAILPNAIQRSTQAPSLSYGMVAGSWGEAQATVSLWASSHPMVIPGHDTSNDTCRTWVCPHSVRTWEHLRRTGRLNPPTLSLANWLGAMRDDTSVCCAMVQFKKLPDYATFCSARTLGRDAFSKAFYQHPHLRPPPPAQPLYLRNSASTSANAPLFVVTILQLPSASCANNLRSGKCSCCLGLCVF
jgi:hypothetical protein